eukprot:CAMPEP_0198309548 /NCGR_PEP_ID=MMETSP1450-20131203/1913_1 /TAXON_ID=753684 ORGANISM="Madagascaria erythrocladiodes, Strain CCMP3234" /NCGR_SAMPLE_ID=MMETSP1450 /ASSEMBLY_ACC=CAM_ASM_001115 /LENGTH=404 /DNA_ID=CAMNT_0044012311 /DNA_START=64 /DNA_END=1278 /DNA_ORIENTATION=-
MSGIDAVTQRLFTDGHPAREWLQRPPRSALTLSKSDVSRSVMCVTSTETPMGVDEQEFLSVPAYSLPDKGLVLGTIFFRYNAQKKEQQPLESSNVDPSVVEADMVAGYDAAMANFVLDLASGRLVHVSYVQSGAMYLAVNKFAETGVYAANAGVFDSQGALVTEMVSQPDCQFCMVSGRACECSDTMRSRAIGRPMSFASWGQIVEDGKKNFAPTRSYAACQVGGYPILPEGCSLKQSISFKYDVDPAMKRMQASYLHHLTIVTSRVPVWPWTMLESGDEADHQVSDLGGDLGDLWTDWMSFVNDQLPKAAEKGDKTRSKKCPHCEKTYTKTNHLTRHIATAHKNERPFVCNVCDASFAQENNLKRHYNNIHEGKKPYECTACSKTFATAHGLKRHIQHVRHEA